MKRLFASATSLATVFAMGLVVSAQNTGQTQPPTQTNPPAAQAATAQDQQMESVTLTGCVQLESEYRRAHNIGEGGVAGTGVGTANEFILVNATASGAAAPIGTAGTATTAPPTGTPPTTPPATPPAMTPPTTTTPPPATTPTEATASGTMTAPGMAYELTGAGEGTLTGFVGRRVEITGRMKKAEVAAGGATGGITEQVPGSRDLKLREVEVLTVKQATGSCAAK